MGLFAKITKGKSRKLFSQEALFQVMFDWVLNASLSIRIPYLNPLTIFNRKRNGSKIFLPLCYASKNIVKIGGHMTTSNIWHVFSIHLWPVYKFTLNCHIGIISGLLYFIWEPFQCAVIPLPLVIIQNKINLS